MGKIRFIGTGSGFAVLQRNPSSIIIENKGKSVMLDCGDGTTRQLLRFDVDPLKIDGLVLSHMHPDHSGGIPFLVQTIHLMKRFDPFYIYVPNETTHFIRELILRSYLFPEKMKFDLRIIPLYDRKKFDFSEISIEAYSNDHLKTHPKLLKKYNDLNGESYSLKITCGDTRIVYSSDISGMQDLDEICKSGGDILICEAMHINLSKLKQFLEKNLFKRVILTHISKSIEESKSEIGDEFILATDGLIMNF